MLNFEYVTQASRLPAIAEEVANSPAMALDLETTALSPLDGKIRLLSINTGSGVYVIDAFKCGTLDPVIRALADSKGLKIGQNLKFDQKWLLYHHDLELWPIFDTFRASQVMWNGRQMGHNLWDLYRRELEIDPSTQDLGGSDWSAWDLSKEQLEYAAEDVIWLPKLYEVMRPKLKEKGLFKVALIEFGALLPEGAVELNGFNLDPAAWKKLANESIIKKATLSQLLWNELPSPTNQLALPGLTDQWNLDSTPQMLAALTKLGMKVYDKEQQRWLPLDNTREMTLATQAAKFPIVEKILDYREASTRVKSFGVDYLEYINEMTGRIHPEYWGFLLAGRYACRNPNLAQIPRAKEFRKCFVAPPGYRLVLCDYSNIEMRIVAEISGDNVLIKVFCDGEDAHYYTAGILTGKTKDQITKQERQQAKPVNFGFIYGMQPAKLVLYALANYGVTLSEKEAADFRKKYFERFRGIAKWHDRCQRDGKRTKMAVTLAGRLRYLEDPNAYNEFYNTPVQGTGADGLKMALRETYFAAKTKLGRPPCRTLTNPNPDIKMVHHVHDEIILEVKDDPTLDKECQELLAGAMKRGMQPLLRRVPVDAEAASGYTWADKS